MRPQLCLTAQVNKFILHNTPDDDSRDPDFNGGLLANDIPRKGRSYWVFKSFF